jgi:phosphopantetheinyl transferase (holo-ACP synthase)
MSKENINVHLLTNYSPKSCFFIEKVKVKKSKYSLSNSEELPTFILVDDQLLLLIRKDNGKKKVAALWTNYEAFVKALKTLFTELWNNNA